ncbi:MAG: alanine/ornithine racemase family PLP-dependent enzyme [Bradymonadales bacterium]|nr:alanine/ornithine racemase family PLP-dependent enzyme [Bradymonadales bacterium]
MSRNPRLLIRPSAIRHNARAILGWCGQRGITLCAVTKVTCAHPAVVRAYLDAGVRELGDSRVENLATLRNLAGSGVHLLLLRLPMISQVREVVEVSDSCLVSEAATLTALSQAACSVQKRYGVILMVDLGDLREGVWPDRLAGLAAHAAGLEGISLRGVGVNLACYGGVEPTVDNMRQFVSLAMGVCHQHRVERPVLSGGNSANLPLLLAGGMPEEVNHLRIGESALLGVSVLDRAPLAGLRQDGFEVQGEVVELQRKPSIPIGKRAQNAFGETPEFADRGLHRRAILAIGRQDAAIEGLMPLRQGVEILGASSDHLILDVERVAGQLQVGDRLGFRPTYGCLLAACTSAYVAKQVVEDRDA